MNSETLILGGEETRENNRRAFREGYDRGRKTVKEKDLAFSPGEGADAMLAKFAEFDRQIIYNKYQAAVEKEEELFVVRT